MALRGTTKKTTMFSDKARGFIAKFTPQHSDASLFLISWACALLFLGNSGIREDLYMFIREDAGNLRLMIPAFLGMAVSVYFALTNREKTKSVKTVMLLFAVIVNLVVGIATLSYLGNSDLLWYLAPIFIIALWNIITSFILIFLIRIEVVDGSSISDKDARFHEIVVGSIVVSLVFVLGHYLGSHWTATLSMCVAYATSLNNALNRLFFPRGLQ